MKIPIVCVRERERERERDHEEEEIYKKIIELK